MKRFFVNRKIELNNTIKIEGIEHNHIKNVMRMIEGGEIILVCGYEYDYFARIIKITKGDTMVEIFDKKISSAPTPEEKANLYTERSKFLFELPFNDENTFKDKILSDLLEADSLEKSPDSAYILYDRYSFFGDKEKSEYYLNLYYDRIQKGE